MRHTFEQYLAYELPSELKHEFADGEIYEVAGLSPRLSALASRITAALGAILDLATLYADLPH